MSALQRALPLSQGDDLAMLITEDLDLSYRSQLAGWRGRFLFDTITPAELPTDINAFKSQQHRWAKGLTECLFKLMPRIWRSDIGLKRNNKFLLDANSGENCVNVVPIYYGFAGAPIPMNLSDGGCISGTLGTAPLMVAGTEGAPL